MTNLLPKTVEGWNAKKRQFMRLFRQQQPWTHMAYVYENAINYCDKKIAKICLVILACLILAISGCSKTMRGTGLIFEGFGDAVVAGGQHLQESANTEK